MSDAIGLNHGTPHELLAAGGQLALKGDIWDDLSVQNIVQKILDLFGLDIPNWQEIIASFDGLRDAFEGTYVGNDPALNVIQNIVKTLRNGLTGIIDWARIPQLSLSQLTNQPGPSLLSGFGDFADADTMDGGGDWTWDGTVGGGSARATGSGARKVLTSELVAVSEGQQMTAAGKVRWSGASGSGAAMQLVVMPFVGDAAQSEVVISNITSPPASSSGNFVALSGSYTPAAGVTGVRVRITVEAALTAGTVWWDDVSLRKVATSLPQQFISGLTDALGDLGDWIKHLVDQITTALGLPTVADLATGIGNLASEFGDMLGNIEDGAANLSNLLNNLLHSPATVLGTLPQTLLNDATGWLTTALGGKASTAAIDTLNTFIQNLVNAILQALRGVPVVGGTLADIISDLGGVKDTADSAQQQISTGNNGQLLSTGVLDGLQYQLSVFTANGTFTPPAPPAGYEIAYYMVTAYRGGWGGGGGSANVGGLSGRDGGRTVARVSAAQMGASQPVTVGSGGASNGGAGGRTYLGASGSPLVEAISATSSIPSAYGAIASSSRPGAGGRGCTYPGRDGEDGGSSAGAEGGEGGSTSSVAGKAGVAGGIVDNYSHGGSGGGGGGFNGSTTGAGGAGGAPGGGGGGGGSNSSSGKSGGVGARGQLDVCTYFKLIGT